MRSYVGEPETCNLRVRIRRQDGSFPLETRLLHGASPRLLDGFALPGPGGGACSVHDMRRRAQGTKHQDHPGVPPRTPVQAALSAQGLFSLCSCLHQFFVFNLKFQNSHSRALCTKQGAPTAVITHSQANAYPRTEAPRVLRFSQH